jgi:dsRNA-specific ribonuclease
LIAAIYLDGGVEHAAAFIQRQFADLIEAARARLRASRLQVRAAGACAVTVATAAGVSWWSESGPDHHKTFQVEVRVGGEPLAEARAEQERSGTGSRAGAASG